MRKNKKVTLKKEFFIIELDSQLMCEPCFYSRAKSW